MGSRVERHEANRGESRGSKVRSASMERGTHPQSRSRPAAPQPGRGSSTAKRASSPRSPRRDPRGELSRERGTRTVSLRAGAGVAFALLGALCVAPAQAQTCTENAVKLVRGTNSSEGHVEICSNSRFSSICDDDWDNNDARVVCRQLGYHTGTPTYASTFGLLGGTFFLAAEGGSAKIGCTGIEAALHLCPLSGATARRCHFSERAGVRCAYPVELVPTITGTRRVGQTLTADTSAISQNDTLTLTYSYRWVRLDGMFETDIGTDSETYVAVAADAGKRIKVEVTFTDTAMFTATSTSAAIPIRAATSPATCPAFSVPTRHTQLWAGTVTVASEDIDTTTSAHGYIDKTSGSDLGSLSDTDFDHDSETYRIVGAYTENSTDQEGILRFGFNTADTLTDRLQAGLHLHVCGETYDFAEAMHDASNNRYGWSSAGLDWSSLAGSTRAVYLTLPANVPATGAPAVSGQAQVGATLTAITSAIRDSDGFDDADLDYRWIRVDGMTETNISGATGRAYRLAAADAGKRVKVKVSFTDLRANDETLTSAAFPATGTVRAAPVIADPGVLSATLTVQTIGADTGCSNAFSASKRCSSTAVLSEDEFTQGGTTYSITQLRLTSDRLSLSTNVRVTSTTLKTLVMEVTEGTSKTTFDFSDATQSDKVLSWPGNGLSWSDGDTVTITMTEDVTPPALARGAPSVPADGRTISVSFDEALDTDNLPPGSAFTITTDGPTRTVTGVTATDEDTIELTLSPAVEQDSPVTLAYTDPTSDDDATALQDGAGNDVATFKVAVTNGSTLLVLPGKPPTGLTATAVGGTRIDLSWTAPTSAGDEPIIGYRIDRSPDGIADWEVLQPVTEDAGTTYSDRGLASETTRHYRVAAVNVYGAGPHSNSAGATTADIAGPVPQSAEVPSEGNALLIRFDEAVEEIAAPVSGLFTVTVDGIAVPVTSATLVAGDSTRVRLEGFGLVVRKDQTKEQVVRVRYADPSSGDDTVALEDEHGNDVGSFRLGPDTGNLFRVRNNSTVRPTAPDAPSGLVARGKSDTEIVLTWTAPADNGGFAITGYRIEHCAASCDQPSALWQSLVANTHRRGTTYSNSELAPGTTRYYRVSAINFKGRSPASGIAGTTAADETGPAPSRGFARGTYARIWFDEAIEGTKLPPASAFEVTADGGPIEVGGVKLSEGTTAVLELNPLSPAIRRGQVLRLRYTDPSEANDANALQDALGNLAESFTLGSRRGDAGPFDNNSKVAPTAPGAPTGLSATRSGETGVELSWTVPESTGGRPIMGYWIEYCATSCDQASAVWHVVEDHTQSVMTSYTDGGLVVAETRHYRVRAVNAIGEGQPSETATVTVPGVLGLLFSRESLTIDEGESASYTVRLTVPPTGTVTVALTVTGGNVTASPTRLSFSSSNWSVAQTVTVSGEQDADAADERAVVTHAPSGANYGQVVARNVMVEVGDDEVLRAGAVRLREREAQADGSVVGRLEVGYHGRWGTVCNDRIYEADNLAPAMACRMAGFAGGEAVENRNTPSFNAIQAQASSSYHAGQPLERSIVPIWLDDLRCHAGSAHWTGDGPQRLDQCYHAGLGRHNCKHSEDVWLNCSGTLGAGEDVRVPDKPALAVNNAKATEGRNAHMWFTVALSQVLTGSQRLVVDYETEEVPDGTRYLGTERDAATEGVDYRRTSGTLVFTSGSPTSRTFGGSGPTIMLQSFRVPIVDDRVPDSGEIFRVRLSDIAGTHGAEAQFSRATATGIIFNDESETDLVASFAKVPASHDGSVFTLELTFVEMVQVTAASLTAALDASGGVVTQITQRDANDTRYWTLTVTPTSAAEAVTLVLRATEDCEDEAAVCTSDGRRLEVAVETTVGTALALAGTLSVSGTAQAGSTLEASFARPPAGRLAWQWLRGGTPIEGATASTHTATADDVGHALSARVSRGEETVTSAATVPVWSAASRPDATAGEEALLSTTLTLGSYQGGGRSLAGYLGGAGGAIDDASFEEDDTSYAIQRFAVDARGEVVVVTEPVLGGEGLVAYWNAHRIGELERQAAFGTTSVFVGTTPQDRAELARYLDGSADGVRVGVTLRRAYEVARVVSARVASGPGENGTWDTDETVEAEVRFSAPVTVAGPEGAVPTLSLLLDGAGREAAFTGGSGSDTLRFGYTVTAEDDGAREARVAPGGLALNGATITDGDGRAAETGFALAPWVVAVTLASNASGDHEWTAGESVEAQLTYNEAVTVEDGTPTLGITVAGDAGTLDYASGSGSETLVFSRAVTDSERLSAIAVIADSLALNGARIVSQASELAAESGHPGTEPTSVPTLLTAEFTEVPAAHGNQVFELELEFTEPLGDTFSYQTFVGTDATASVFEVTNGTVKEVERVAKQGAERNRRWWIRLYAHKTGDDVTVTLPASPACGETGAVCTGDGRPLAKAVTATVPATATARTEQPDPFTVAFRGVPGEHDGSRPFIFELRFNKQPKAGYSYETLRDHTLELRQGEARLVPYVARRDKSRNDRWQVTVPPSKDAAVAKADITMSLGPKASCSATGAVCTAEDEALSNTATATILGPPGLSVADDEVREGPGATLDFEVTLSRGSTSQITVDYATSDGTATKGEDYTARSGTLTFAPGDTEKTVAVPVLVDTVDDDGETVTLTLTNPRGGNAWLSDATATGTIRNTGDMPAAWLVRFGRTLASQAVDVVGGRMEGAGGGNHVQIGGIALNGAGQWSQDDGATHLGIDDLAWNPRDETQSMTGRELVLGSAFSLGAGGEHGAPAVGAWGRVDLGTFDGEEDSLRLDGEVTTAFLGADIARERWLAGLAVSFSSGDGSFSAIEGSHAGTVESELTSLYPYARVSLNDKVSTWALVGVGSGELTLRHAQGAMARTELTTDTAMRMGALGVRGEVLTPTEANGLTVAIRSDAFWVEMESGDTEGMRAAEGEANRVRVIVEGSRAFDTGGGTLTPSAEIGLRHDGGDAETGAGFEIGGALRYARGSLELEGSVRTLVAHEASGYEEWGASGAVRVRPGASGRGLSLSIAPSAGNPGSGTGALWSARDARALAPEPEFEVRRRLDAEVGYGLGAPRALGLVTPYAGLSLGEDGHRAWRTGTRWQLAREATFGLEASRSEGRQEFDPVNAVKFRGQVRW